MTASRLGLLSGFALFIVGFGSPAAACNVGDIQCDAAGYRYVCECWTATGCSYTQYGTCSSYHPSERGLGAEPVAYSVRLDGPRSNVARHLGLGENNSGRVNASAMTFP